MEIAWIVLAIAAFVCLMILLISYICFKIAFFVDRKKVCASDEAYLPEGEIYLPHREQIVSWAKETRNMPHEEFMIKSFDGLDLFGKYYEFSKDAPIELMFHGYRGTAERDLSGGVQRCFKLGRSALIVDQRCSGKSGGNVITFGVKEHKDCLKWVEFMVEHFGSDVKIILTGISMGASTVLTAGGKELPENVIGILADCGFTSAKDIIKKVIGQMKLPVNISYFFVKLGARIFGHFDLEEISAIEGVKKCKVPVIFIHGEADDYVPCEMSRRLFEACNSRKELVTVPGAGHGLAFLVGNEFYFEKVTNFKY
ncbi:MAG: alpha/beta hydrolase [Ruminococcaceae bacterium]|nr:alpha/beta hydrolase [Oscillospiraceae bacterium]